MRAALIVAAMLAAGLSGCSEGPSTVEEGPGGPHVVTDPSDFSQLANASDAQPHLHDYWGGKDRLVVLDATQQDVGPGFAGTAQSLPIQEFRPAPGDVIPLGTARVEVTFTWTDATGDMYSAPELWAKTAADDETWKVADIESGGTYAIASTNERNDLPHQRLSAWIFEFRLSSPEAGFLRFKGQTHMVVEAVRGLDIPLFPAHPDFWQGETMLPLVDATAQQAYLVDPGDGGCDGISCAVVHVPADGALVPYDASLVEARLSFNLGSPTQLGLSYHGADSREFTRPDGAMDGEDLVYRIPVSAVNADGPYAAQSLWEFYVVVTGPVPDTLALEEYRLVVTVHK